MELKKHPQHQLEPKRPLFFFIGLLCAFLIVISAFEWRSEIPKIDIQQPVIDEEPIFVAPMTIQKEPPPPRQIKQQVKKVTKVAPEVIEVDPTDLPDFIEEVNKPPVDPANYQIPLIPEEVIPTHNDLVESPASYPGGWDAFNKYVAQNIKIPGKALNIGLNGKVYVQFTINTDGTISEIEIVKGIGLGCDQEVIRVLNTIPKKFTPAKNRGRVVRVR